MSQLGPIILLLGSSTSGKDTIANKLKSFATDDPIVWEIETLNVSTLDTCFKIKALIDADTEDANLYQNILKLLHYTKVFQAIMCLDPCKENFSEEIAKFIPKSLIECNTTKEIDPELFMIVSASLQVLVQKYHDQFKRFDQIFSDFIMKAISNSRAGRGTIIIMVPPREGDIKNMVIDFFDETIKNANHEGLAYKFIIHCPIAELQKRMLERNRAAKENGNEHDLREGAFPLKQYAKLFVTTSEESSLGNLMKEEAVNFCNKFGANSIEQANILTGLHLDKTKVGGVFFRYPGECHVFNNATPESSEKIAKDMANIIKKDRIYV